MALSQDTSLTPTESQQTGEVSVTRFSDIAYDEAVLTPREGLHRYIHGFGMARPGNAESSKAYEQRLREGNFDINEVRSKGKRLGGIHLCGLPISIGPSMSSQLCVIEHVWSFQPNEAQAAVFNALLTELSIQKEFGRKVFIIETLNPAILLETAIERKRYSGRDVIDAQSFAREQNSFRNESAIIDKLTRAGYEVLDIVGVPYLQPDGWGNDLRPNHTNFKLTVILDPSDMPPSISGNPTDGYSMNGDFYAAYMEAWAKTFESPVQSERDLAILIARKMKGRSIELGQRNESIAYIDEMRELRRRLFTREITPARFGSEVLELIR